MPESHRCCSPCCRPSTAPSAPNAGASAQLPCCCSCCPQHRSDNSSPLPELKSALQEALKYYEKEERIRKFKEQKLKSNPSCRRRNGLQDMDDKTGTPLRSDECDYDNLYRNN